HLAVQHGARIPDGQQDPRTRRCDFVRRTDDCRWDAVRGLRLRGVGQQFGQRAARVLAAIMPVVVSLLRGVNVGGKGMIKMDALRSIYESLGLRDVRTYVQSGNVVFRCDKVAGLAARIEAAIEKAAGFRPPVILRSAEDLRSIVARNPFKSF